MSTFCCGLDPPSSLTDHDNLSSQNAFLDYGYNFITQFVNHATIFHETFKNAKISSNSTSLDLNRNILGKLSLDFKYKKLLHNSEFEEKLKFELQHAQYLGISTIILPLYKHNYIEFAHIICQLLNTQLTHLQIVMELPIMEEDLMFNGEIEDEETDSDESLWQLWSNFSNLCSGYMNRIHLALKVTADLPSNPKVTERWMCEPIKYAILPTSIFISNKKGFPILSKPHQLLVYDIFKINGKLIVSGLSQYSDKSLKVYYEYLEHLWELYQKDDTKPKINLGYEDLLQYPLQPLKDNLDCYTYEIFEQDTPKYEYYEEAIYHCLLDTATNQDQASEPIVLMVLGAGRGPLVTAALNAGKRSQRNLQVFAVEKNPFCVIKLREKNIEEWGEVVTIVEGDMRHWKPPQPVATKAGDGSLNYAFADVLVSELLGSFADNELSPECLYGAEKYLKKGGISIPHSYTSWIAPLMSPKLHAEVAVFEHNHGSYSLQPKMGESSAKSTCYEMPFVVHLIKGMEISPPRPLFTFTHPNPGAKSGSEISEGTASRNQQRYSEITFDPVPLNCMVHGFIGFFETTLYKHVKLSIVPANHTQNMYSWFPIYFPIKDPMRVSKGTSITLNMWRCCDKIAVWYEWAITKPICGEIHNVNGRSYSISLV